MTTHNPPTDDIRFVDASLLRTLLGLLIAGMLCWPVVSTTVAEVAVPAVEIGGSGGGQAPTVSEMLRGDYSPIDSEADDAPAAPEIAGGARFSVSEAIRGDLSPIAFAPEIAGIVAPGPELSVSEMLRGDLSPIA